MRRGMEKERKGLFGRLLDFWKEKIWTGETEGIGFWNGAKNLENPFTEMGDTISVKQGEKKAFWEEKVETVFEEKERGSSVLEQERKFFFAEAEDGREKGSETTEEGEKTEQRKASNLFLTEVFREERQAEERKMGQAFLWEKPEEEKEKRSIVPVAEEAKQERVVAAEEKQEMPKAETKKRQEPQTDAPFDIEKLMQEMTKKLWEERESCGRRLRG